MYYTVETKAAAWKKSDELMPSDYMIDSRRSERAGYDIYYSTREGCNAYVCDLGDRLEVNLENGESVNIWIEPKRPTAAEAVQAVKDLRIESLYGPEVMQKITVTVFSEDLAGSPEEATTYKALAHEMIHPSDVIAAYCNSHGIIWGTISNGKAEHYDHGNGFGHYVCSGIVGASFGHEVEFLQDCTRLLMEAYADHREEARR